VERWLWFAAPLPVEVDVGVACAAGARGLLVFVLFDGPQALQGGGRLEQRAVDAEVLTAEQLVRFGLSRIAQKKASAISLLSRRLRFLVKLLTWKSGSSRGTPTTSAAADCI